MSIQINSDTKICGVCAKSLRDAFRKIGTQSVTHLYFAKHLGLSDSEAKNFVRKLLQEKLLRRREPRSRWLELTPDAGKIIHARATRPIKRKKATELLERTIKIAKEINADGSMTHYVKELYVFGSFLTEKDPIGDLDIGVNIQPRMGKLSKERFDKWAEDFGYQNCSGKSFLEIIFYSRTILLKMLRQRSSYISLHDLSDLDKICAERKLVFKSGRVAAPKHNISNDSAHC